MNGNQISRRITAEQFLRFNEQLLGLVRARVPLDHGLRQMADEMGRGRLQTFASAVADDLERGLQLSETLAKFQPQLSDYYVALVRAGEKGGSLAEVLHHIVTETRRQINHRRVVVTSLAYPAMVLVMAVVIFSLILVKIIPQFVEMFAQLGGDLPVPTQMVINASNALVNHLVPILVVAGVIIAGLIVTGTGRVARPFRDALLLNSPLIGTLVYNELAVSFSRCLGFLLTRGVAMTDALALTASVLRNVIARRFVEKVRESVSSGERFADALERHPFLPPSTCWMIRLAEDRGDLDRTLLDIADFYGVKNEQIRRTIGGMIEPLVILGLGLVIGSIIVSFYLPLFTIPKLIR